MSGKPFSHVVLVARIPPGGKHYRVEPNEGERRAIAAALGIVEVTNLVAEIEVRPAGADAFGVAGALRGSVVQIDVVTLESVPQEVNEAIEVTLIPADSDSRNNNEPAQQAGAALPEDRDIYRGGRIDLGAIVVEHLALGLDPYPRSPGVEFPGHIEDDREPESSPFAALAKLKRDRD